MNWIKYGIFLLLMLSSARVLSASTGTTGNEKIHVVMLNPAEPDFWFWKLTTDFLRAAANDLGVELEVLYSKRDHQLTVSQAKQVLSRESLPDYILTGNEKGSAGGVIKVAQAAGVKVFLFNNPFVSPQDIQHFGHPRDPYSMWIGQLQTDNFSAGYQMGQTLIEQGLKQGLTAPDGTLHIVAMSGEFNTHASLERVRGLEAAVLSYPDQVQLLQVIPGDWSEQTALKKSRLLFKRYQHIGAIWAANDGMAFGAISAAKEIGKTPGKDILFAGCGWSALGIKKVQTRELVTTVGGHFMEGAWALMMIYDYHHGKDFEDASFKSNMYSIDQTNVERFIQAIGSQKWDKIDFTRFSRVLNPSLTTYNFSPDAVIHQLQSVQPSGS